MSLVSGEERLLMIINDRRPGVALVDMIIVISVVIILVALILPFLLRAKERRVRVACHNNLRQLGEAIETYKRDFGEGMKFPPGVGEDFLRNLRNAMKILSEDIFVCPGDVRKSAATSYRGPASPPSPFTDQWAALVADQPENHGYEGVNVLFADNRVEWVPETNPRYFDVVWFDTR